LRLTEELDAASESFSWRVPNLAPRGGTPAPRGGVAGKKNLTAPRPVFPVRPPPGPPPAPPRWEARGGWGGSGGGGEPDAPDDRLPAAGLSFEPERMTAPPHDSGAVLSPRSTAVRPEVARGHTVSHTITGPAAGAGPVALSRVPLTIPPRI